MVSASDSTGSRVDSSVSDELRYLIVNPEKGGIWDLFKYMVFGDITSFLKFLESGYNGGEVFEEEEEEEEEDDDDDDEANGLLVLRKDGSDHRWVIVVSIIVRKVVAFLSKPMEFIGYVVDFVLNLLSLNGDLFGLICNILHGKVVIPQRGTKNFLSTIGHIDGRIDLYRSQAMVDQLRDSDSGEISMKIELGNRALMDLCIMASKLAYENAEVVKHVVHHWKMHFVDFYNCWNDFQKERSTQVFILCDKPKDANLILISFRGTEPFDADDWSTDFDYSWYKIPELGKVHMGFLEAIGLGNRRNVGTFHHNLKKSETNNLFEDGNIPPEKVDESAYYIVKTKLKRLLEEHKNAKFVVTGHSLGGALAIMFPTILVLHEEMELMKRLLGVYTFGQPRIGNRQVRRYMEAHLDTPEPKYFRVVYSNDLVPRLPYDDRTFLYKHFGVCLYYNSCYIEKKTKEEPNRNYFGVRYLVPVYLNAVWELARSLTMGYTLGPEYREGWLSIMVRIMGLVLPGISAHCPTDYVNSVRLGQERTVQMSSL